MWAQFLAWFYPISICFLVGVGVWALVTVQRMNREQAIAIAILETLAARAGLKELIDKIQGAAPTVRRRTDDTPRP